MLKLMIEFYGWHFVILVTLRCFFRQTFSARDEKEVAWCIKDLNSPGFHPSMVSLWVTDSFERKDMERDLLAKLLVNLAKSREGMLSQGQLIKGYINHFFTFLFKIKRTWTVLRNLLDE